jgi:hypothetical protein
VRQHNVDYEETENNGTDNNANAEVVDAKKPKLLVVARKDNKDIQKRQEKQVTANNIKLEQ